MEKNPLVPVLGGLAMGWLLLPVTPLPGMAMMGVCGYALYSALKRRGRWATLWKQCGLTRDEMYPELRERRRHEYGEVLRFSLPPGLSKSDFERKKEALEDFLGKDINIAVHNRNLILELYDGPMAHYPYEYVDTGSAASFAIGRTRSGKDLIVDMSDEPHLLIAGETGSGKSVLLRGIVASLLQKDVRLHLIDLKGGVELGAFRRSGQVASFGRTAIEALSILQTLDLEVERRYNQFYAHDAIDIKEYRRKSHEALKTEYLIVDEFAELMHEAEAKDLLKSICARARGCAIYVVLATQRPDKDVIDGLIKANITNTVGLRAHNEINSRVIIDDAGLEQLRGSGHGLYKSGGRTTEFQAPMITIQQARQLIAHTYRPAAAAAVPGDGRCGVL